MRAIKTRIAAAACTATLLCAGSAMAAQTTQLTINANVAAECKFTAGPYSMQFNTLSPSATADANTSTAIQYQCTKGTAASSIKINSAASPTTVNIPNTINSAITLPVRLTWATPGTAGAGIGSAFPDITATVSGTILKADINAAVAGAYTATYSVDLLP